MSKISQYLNQHLSGETSSDPSFRARYAHDGGMLSYLPELVVLPRSTSDVRKAFRFSWQLAEKGHTVHMYVRGGGTDASGASVGSGVLIALDYYMQSILELDSKQRLVRLQPGVTEAIVQSSLSLHGLTLPVFTGEHKGASIGGIIASGSSGIASAKYGTIDRHVKQLEVVLTSGDILQTGRLNKRELGRKKGLQTHEGDIYRKIDALIDDNKELVEQIGNSSQVDRVGYPGIADVRHKDGSIDLTPLFIGSQGTLGVISEIIIQAELLSSETYGGLALFDSIDAARDGIELVTKSKPAIAQLIDNSLLKLAESHGKEYGGVTNTSVAIIYAFDDFSERARQKHVSKLHKVLGSIAKSVTDIRDRQEVLRILQLTNDGNPLLSTAEGTTINILPDAFVPLSHLGTAFEAVELLAKKHRIDLVSHVNIVDQTLHVRPVIDLSKVTDRQNALKIFPEFVAAIHKLGGSVAVNGSEGRLAAAATHALLDEAEHVLYEQIRAIFDEFAILNQGVKTPNDTRELAKHLSASIK